MELKVQNEYKIQLQPLVDRYGIGKEIYSSLQVIEVGVKDSDGKLIDGKKSLQLVNNDEFEMFASSDGSFVEVLDIYDDGNVELRDVYNQTEFILKKEDAEIALVEP